jgi:hypothetical protein
MVRNPVVKFGLIVGLSYGVRGYARHGFGVWVNVLVLGGSRGGAGC